MLSDSYYERCARASDGGCMGNISFEEVILYAGRQLKEKWAIIPLCHRHHGIGVWMGRGDMDKRKNEWIALNRATVAELKRISKATDYIERRKYLNKIYELNQAG